VQRIAPGYADISSSKTELIVAELDQVRACWNRHKVFCVVVDAASSAILDHHKTQKLSQVEEGVAAEQRKLAERA